MPKIKQNKPPDNISKSQHANVRRGLARTRRLHAGVCQLTAADVRWSVIGFKLQKHESSFKHLLFTASLRCAAAQPSEHAACFSKDAGKTSRDFTDVPQTDNVYLSCLADLNELSFCFGSAWFFFYFFQNVQFFFLFFGFVHSRIHCVPFFFFFLSLTSQPDISRRKRSIHFIEQFRRTHRSSSVAASQILFNEKNKKNRKRNKKKGIQIKVELLPLFTCEEPCQEKLLVDSERGERLQGGKKKSHFPPKKTMAAPSS